MHKKLLISSILSSVLLMGCGGSSSSSAPSDSNSTDVLPDGNNSSNNTQYTLSLKLETQPILINDALIITAEHNLPNTVNYKWTLTGPNGLSEVAPEALCQQQCTLYPNMLGKYSLELEADNQAHTLTETLQFTVTNASTAQLQAVITGPSEVYRGTTVELNAGESEFIENTVIAWQLVSTPENSNASLSQMDQSKTRFQTDSIGTYKVALTLTSGQQTSTKEISVNAIQKDENLAPVASISISGTTINTDTELTLSGKDSFDADNDPLTYAWDIVFAPANTAYTLENKTNVDAKFKAQDPGTYEVSLTVSDGQAQHTATKQLQVNAQDVPPVASINANKHAKQGDTVDYQALTLKAKKGRDLHYTWALVSKPSGSQAAFTDLDIERTTLSVDKTGEYISELYITEGNLTSSAARHILTVQQNRPPYVNASSSSISIKVGATATIKVNGSDPDGDVLTYNWNITDQPVNSTFTLEHNNTDTASLVADKSGWYMLQVHAHDGFQQSLMPWSMIIQVID